MTLQRLLFIKYFNSYFKYIYKYYPSPKKANISFKNIQSKQIGECVAHQFMC